jgi:hypothetical protein
VQIAIVSDTLNILNGNNTLNDNNELVLPSLDGGTLLTFGASGTAYCNTIHIIHICTRD